MLMVVFGAGASYDSVPHRNPASREYAHLPQRPPLANQLFEDRPLFLEGIQRFPQCRPIVPLLRHLPSNRSFEQVLAEFQAEAEEYPNRRVQLAAVRYYLHFTLWECQRVWGEEHKGTTNYLTLLDQIEHWRCLSRETVCLATFNYDTMLEQALQEFRRMTVTELSDYISRDDYKIIKLHGSINWGREIDSSPSLDCIEDFAQLSVTKRYRIVATHPIPHKGNGVLLPAIALPIERKTSFECPDEHLELLKALLPKVTKIIAIGWRGSEVHFLELLRTSFTRPPSLMVVAGNRADASETGARRVNAGVAANDPDYTNGGFTNAILNHDIERFLKVNVLR